MAGTETLPHDGGGEKKGVKKGKTQLNKGGSHVIGGEGREETSGGKFNHRLSAANILVLEKKNRQSERKEGTKKSVQGEWWWGT